MEPIVIVNVYSGIPVFLSEPARIGTRLGKRYTEYRIRWSFQNENTSNRYSVPFLPFYGVLRVPVIVYETSTGTTYIYYLFEISGRIDRRSLKSLPVFTGIHYIYINNIDNMAEVKDISDPVKSNEDGDLRSEHKIDDDDDDMNEHDGTSTDLEQVNRRDEEREVRKMSSKDTNRLRLWRTIVACVLFVTSFAVTFTTYTLLKQQEDDNFQTAVRSLLLSYLL